MRSPFPSRPPVLDQLEILSIPQRGIGRHLDSEIRNRYWLQRLVRATVFSRIMVSGVPPR